MNGYDEQIDEIERCVETILSAVRFLREALGRGSAQAETSKAITLETVRAALAEKSREGFTAEVKALIAKYGAAKLSGVGSEHYAELLNDAEVIGNDG